MNKKKTEIIFTIFCYQLKLTFFYLRSLLFVEFKKNYSKRVELLPQTLICRRS